DNGGFMALGSTFSYGQGDYDLYLVRLDSLGDTLWTKTYGGSGTDFGYDIARASDGGYILTGMTRSSGLGKGDVYLLKISSLGQVLWSKTFGGSERDEGLSVREAPDKGFIIAGSTESFGAGAEDFYLIKVDSLGELEWSRVFGGPGSEWTGAVRVSADGGFVLVGGSTSDANGYSDVVLMKLNSVGDSLWTRKYGGAAADLGFSIEVTADDGFVIVGASASWTSEYNDAYVIKTDSIGTLEWENTFGGVFDERAFSAVQIADGGYMVSGITESFGAGKTDVYMFRLDAGGWQLWSQTYGGSESESCRGSLLSADQNIILIGLSYSNSQGGSDLFLVKAQSDLATDVKLNELSALPKDFELGQNYPNPFNPKTTIPFSISRSSAVTLFVYNVIGQKVATLLDRHLSAGQYQVQWDGRRDDGGRLASGIYFYRLKAGERVFTNKMALLK
ncbi:MAG: T9SS type A sorting domain-containing protein, partial [candidate division Zixibacteria bacterium]|nr:T9SS type A sorting domain-containing protein [candidate division Zixibacteria bacterium]